MPVLSVIIPVYNTGAFLPKCLDSVLHQTLTDLEVLCVDNNSTDNSLEILRRYARQDSRVRVLQQPVQGQSAARNMGLDYATGQYIGFVDSDDAIDLRYYETLYRAARETQADVVCTGLQEVVPGKAIAPIRYCPPVLCADWDTRWQAGSTAWSKIYSRQFIEGHSLRFPTGLIWEDVLWVLQTLFWADRLAIMQGNGYLYTINPQGTVGLSATKNRAKTLHDIQTVFSLSKAFISQYVKSRHQQAKMLDFAIDKLFIPSVVEDAPSLLQQISAWTRWKWKRRLLLAPNLFCFVERIEFHQQYYYVLRLLGFKIRLWKCKQLPLQF